MLERISDQLGDLELELSYSVEASADLGLLVPSLRAENFHNALYDSMGLAGKAVTVGRMLARLHETVGAHRAGRALRRHGVPAAGRGLPAGPVAGCAALARLP